MPGPLTLALPRRCAGWVNKPAIRFHLADSENFFHYLNDALLPVLDVLHETGLTPAHIVRRASHDCVPYPKPFTTP